MINKTLVDIATPEVGDAESFIELALDTHTSGMPEWDIPKAILPVKCSNTVKDGGLFRKEGKSPNELGFLGVLNNAKGREYLLSEAKRISLQFKEYKLNNENARIMLNKGEDDVEPLSDVEENNDDEINSPPKESALEQKEYAVQMLSIGGATTRSGRHVRLPPGFYASGNLMCLYNPTHFSQH